MFARCCWQFSWNERSVTLQKSPRILELGTREDGSGLLERLNLLIAAGLTDLEILHDDLEDLHDEIAAGSDRPVLARRCRGSRYPPRDSRCPWPSPWSSRQSPSSCLVVELISAEVLVLDFVFVLAELSDHVINCLLDFGEGVKLDLVR